MRALNCNSYNLARNGADSADAPQAPLGRLPVRDVWEGVQDGAGADPAPVLLPLLPVHRLSQEIMILSLHSPRMTLNSDGQLLQQEHLIATI